MDPEMFILSAAALGLPFTLAKTLAAFTIGLLGGFGTLSAQRLCLFKDPLSGNVKNGCRETTCQTSENRRVTTTGCCGFSGASPNGAACLQKALAKPAGSWASG